MRNICLGFAFGILCCQLGADLPLPEVRGWALWLALAGGVAARLASRRTGWPWRALLMTLAAVAAGWSFAGWRAEVRLADALAPELEGRDVLVTGVVASLPQDFERGLRFVFEVEQSEAPLPRTISVAWYRGFRDEEPHAVPEVHAGERWRLAVRLKRPHGNVNPHAFDYEGWLLEQGIRATGYVRPAGGNARLDAFVPGVMTLVERTRETIRERFRHALPESPYAGVLVALAVGDQRAISP